MKLSLQAIFIMLVKFPAFFVNLKLAKIVQGSKKIILH
jgi:hypothetical protein